MLSAIFFVNWVLVDTSLGNTSDLAGISKTSSKESLTFDDVLLIYLLACRSGPLSGDSTEIFIDSLTSWYRGVNIGANSSIIQTMGGHQKMDKQRTYEALTPYQSSHFTQSFLHELYSELNIEDAQRKSYQNSNAMSYYLQHGQNYLENADRSSIEIRPVLLFYGLVQLIKSLLLTVDPNYPSNTDVLAHGVTTRKRKRANYNFLDDNVKIQTKGLYTHGMSQLFHLNTVPAKKWSMGLLLKSIPEIQGLFLRMNRQKPLIRVYIMGQTLTVNERILDSLHMTPDRFCNYLAQQSGIDFQLERTTVGDLSLVASNDIQPSLTHYPFFKNMQDELFLPSHKELYHELPEIFIHYLVLYNLSMICRYETEWWYDLHSQRASNDRPFIIQFLEISHQKIPKLVGEYLLRCESLI